MHGWTTSTFEDAPEFGALQWTEAGLRPDELPALFEQRRALGFTPGQDDWWLRGTAACEFSLLCCHEGDLHLKTNDLRLVARLIDALDHLGISLSAVAD